VSSFTTTADNAGAIAFDGTYLWQINRFYQAGVSNQLTKMDQNGNIISSFDCAGMNPGGLTFDGSSLLQSDQDKIYSLPLAGDYFYEYPDFSPRYLEWDNLYLWGNSGYSDYRLHRWAVSGGDTLSFSLTFGSSYDQIGGICNDGSNWWMVENVYFRQTGKIYQLNADGTLLNEFKINASLPEVCGMAHDGTYIWLLAQESTYGGKAMLYKLSSGN
jgi:hypothetical protein